jgi:hypothetical protein
MKTPIERLDAARKAYVNALVAVSVEQWPAILTLERRDHDDRSPGYAVTVAKGRVIDAAREDRLRVMDAYLQKIKGKLTGC